MTEQGPLRILYMEDDPGLATLFRRKMEREGYKVDHAENGRQGLNMLKENSYDLLVVDHQMPIMTGLETVRELSGSGHLIPTIMITGAGNERVAVEAMKLGATDYVIKDIEGLYLDLIPSVLQGTLAKHELMEEKRKSDRELIKVKERLEAILNATSDMAALVDSSGRFLAANSTFADRVGHDIQGLLGKTFFDFFGSEASEGRRKAFNGVLSSGKPSKTEDTDNGYYYEMTLQPVKESEHGVGGVAIFLRDITEHRKAEELVVRSARLDAVADVVGGVAHSFNNLLQIVLGEARIALGELSSKNYEGIEESLEQIIESSIRGAQTVKLLQSFSATRSNSPVTEGSTFDLSEIASKAIELTLLWWNSTDRIQDSNLEINSNLTPGCLILGKEDEMLEVAISLIKNKVQSSNDPGAINVRTFKDNDQVVFQVSEPEKSIDYNSVQKVFGAAHGSEAMESISKGLVSSFGIVNRHGGQISVSGDEDDPGAIVVKLPASNLINAPTLEYNDADISPKTILVIDDLQPILNVISGKLKRMNHKIIQALSGEEGLEYFENTYVDLVICDLMMPGMSGWDVAQKMLAINEARGLQKTPFLLMTGWSGHLDENPKIEQFRIDGILEKPIKFSELFSHMRRLIPEKVHQ